MKRLRMRMDWVPPPLASRSADARDSRFFEEHGKRARARALAYNALDFYHAERAASPPASLRHLLASERRTSLADARSWLTLRLRERELEGRMGTPQYTTTAANTAARSRRWKQRPSHRSSSEHSVAGDGFLFGGSPVANDELLLLMSSLSRHAAGYQPEPSPAGLASLRAARGEAWQQRRAEEDGRWAAARAFDEAVGSRGASQQELVHQVVRGILGTGQLHSAGGSQRLMLGRVDLSPRAERHSRNEASAAARPATLSPSTSRTPPTARPRRRAPEADEEQIAAALRVPQEESPTARRAARTQLAYGRRDALWPWEDLAEVFAVDRTFERARRLSL